MVLRRKVISRLLCSSCIFLGLSSEETTLSPTFSDQTDSKKPHPQRPKAKGKWMEPVDMDNGRRYVVSCHREGDMIAIIGAREAVKHKRRIRR